MVSDVLGEWSTRFSQSPREIASLTFESFCSSDICGDLTEKKTKVLLHSSDAVLQYGNFLLQNLVMMITCPDFH